VPNYKIFQESADSLRTRIYGVDSGGTVRPLLTTTDGKMQVMGDITIDSGDVVTVVNKSGNPLWVKNDSGDALYVVNNSGDPFWVKNDVGDSLYIQNTSGTSAWVKNDSGDALYVVNSSGDPFWVKNDSGDALFVQNTSGSPAWVKNDSGDALYVVNSSGDPFWVKNDSGDALFVQNTSGSPAWVKNDSGDSLYVTIHDRTIVDSGAVALALPSGTNSGTGAVHNILDYSTYTYAVKNNFSSGNQTVRLESCAISGGAADADWVQDNSGVTISHGQWKFLTADYLVKFARLKATSDTGGSGTFSIYFQAQK
jgi:hypothetical protein